MFLSVVFVWRIVARKVASTRDAPSCDKKRDKTVARKEDDVERARRRTCENDVWSV